MTNSQTTYSEILVPALRPYAHRIALFGSQARGEAGPTSDIDVLVSLRNAMDRPPLGFRWFELEAELTDRLGRTVDLVTENALSPRIRPYVEQDLIVLYEEG
jgi:hypothetical protein